MGCHLVFFKRLDGKQAKKQGLQSAGSNVFAVFVDITLLGGLGYAYNQILWRLLSTKKTIPPELADTLVDLSDSPWALFRRKVFCKFRHIKRVWFVSLACAIIPFLLIFPPGGVTTEFENQLKKKLPNVKTMNISDYGDGTLRQFVEHSLFEMNADLNYNPASSRPQLKAMATQVLTSGEPVRIDSPCGSACVYNISLEGPTFHCVEPEAKYPNCTSHSPIYEAEDLVKNGAPGGGSYALGNNAFKIIWDPEPIPNGCDPKSRRSLVCRMKLSTYNLKIEHSLNASRSIKATVDNHRDVWTNESWVQSQFYSYYFNSSGTEFNPRPQPIHPDELHTNFTKSQAFAIRQAAISALQGVVLFSKDGESRYFGGNASQVLSSPYIGIFDRYEPKLDISADKIEHFFQDVVISTLSIGMSTHQGDIEARVGAEVYRFNAQIQFYVPYGVCAVVALLINAYGAFCWYQNKSLDGSSKEFDRVPHRR
ncbi:hypothetical protein LCI18_002225 [Fusarium solani-melongenae]|uniref:Uncharacterized protein n=1 Tax=Fusarium solani subsp. cucurbitae TaxID=2747967 RepID=A0ACD3YQT1_FUSSC|nr:hypothetical protein LCI18_002225 [Fusarium solani-melongenae]